MISRRDFLASSVAAGLAPAFDPISREPDFKKCAVQVAKA